MHPLLKKTEAGNRVTIDLSKEVSTDTPTKIMRVNKTLLEQMQISDAEIERHMELLGITPEKLNLLSSHKSLIEDHIDFIVEEFYEKQTETDEIALLIGDTNTLQRLHAA